MAIFNGNTSDQKDTKTAVLLFLAAGLIPLLVFSTFEHSLDSGLETKMGLLGCVIFALPIYFMIYTPRNDFRTRKFQWGAIVLWGAIGFLFSKYLNVHFDSSPGIDHEAEIVKVYNSPRAGRQGPRNFITVKSWRAGKVTEAIETSYDTSINVGDTLIIRTHAGLFKVEWVESVLYGKRSANK